MDMDSFFASIEEREHPEYRGRPVIVGADPQEGQGRGVVSTANYEARKYGIGSAMPISKAYYQCPDGIFLRVNGALYRTVSMNIMELIREYSPRFQQVSVDEAYLDLTGIVQDFDGAGRLAAEVKKRVQEKEGLTASIGIGPSKIVAKIASDYQKPDGLTIVKPHEVKDFLAPLSVRKIPGVGKKTAQVLAIKGIDKVEDIQAMRPGELVDLLGRWGMGLYNLAHGVDGREVEEKGVRKSIGRETTFKEDTSDPGEIREALRDVIDETWQEAIQRGYFFRTVTLKVRLEDFSTFTRAKTLPGPTRDRGSIVQTAAMLLKEFQGQKVRLIGVRLTGLARLEKDQTKIEDFLE